jgi:hypothetical protein
MTATAHALVSGAIAASIPNPQYAIPLAFTAHFIMDAVPHWDFGTNWRSRPKAITGAIAITDTVLGFTVAYFMFGGKVDLWPLAATVAAGTLPDWLEAPYYMFFAKNQSQINTLSKNAGLWEKLTFKTYKTINTFHNKTTFPFGVATQIATVLFFLILLGQI